MEKLQRICLRIIALLGIVIFGYLTLYAWTSSGRIYTSSETVVWAEDHIWKNLLFAAAALLVCAGVGTLADKLSDKLLHCAAAVVSLLVTAACCVLVSGAHAYPDADQIYVYEVAENFFSGDYTNIQTEWYFNAYPYQLGIGLLFGLIMRACRNNDYAVIQYAQAVCIGVTVYALFKVTRELFQSKKASVIVLLCTSLFAPMYLYTLYLYGETFGACFSVLGILFWLLANSEKPRKKGITILYWTLSALSLVVCYTARLAKIIVMIAMVIIGLLNSLTDKCRRSLGVTILILLLALGGQKLSVAYMEKQAGVELADGVPVILKLAMGIQDENENGTGPGSYNAYSLWLYYECGFDGELASEKAFLNLKQTLYRWSKDPAYMVDYMNRKVLNQWNEATYGGFMFTSKQQDPENWVVDLYTGTWADRWYDFLNLYQGLLYAMLLIYFVLLFKGKGKVVFCLPGLFLIGEFFFSVIWEAKSRYIYPYIVLAIPAMAWIMTRCTEMLTGKIKQWRKRNL